MFDSQLKKRIARLELMLGRVGRMCLGSNTMEGIDSQPGYYLDEIMMRNFGGGDLRKMIDELNVKLDLLANRLGYAFERTKPGITLNESSKPVLVDTKTDLGSDRVRVNTNTALTRD